MKDHRGEHGHRPRGHGERQPCNGRLSAPGLATVAARGSPRLAGTAPGATARGRHTNASTMHTTTPTTEAARPSHTNRCGAHVSVKETASPPVRSTCHPFMPPFTGRGGPRSRPFAVAFQPRLSPSPNTSQKGPSPPFTSMLRLLRPVRVTVAIGVGAGVAGQQRARAGRLPAGGGGEHDPVDVETGGRSRRAAQDVLAGSEGERARIATGLQRQAGPVQGVGSRSP